MTVKELIDELQKQNPDALVTITDPMSNSPIFGVFDVFTAIAGNVVIAHNLYTTDLTAGLKKTVDLLRQSKEDWQWEEYEEMHRDGTPHTGPDE